jgi:broad specificity phosphatase PhoE
MTRLFLIRHGEPEVAWGGVADDPGLSPAGWHQAQRAAEALAVHAPLAIVSSPKKRCRETASPFEAQLGLRARVEPRVSEVVAPADVADRRSWLRENFPWDEGCARRQWREADEALRVWRDNAVAAMLELTQDTAVFSHFIAINAIASAALKSEDTIVCVPGYASITELEIADGALNLIRFGEAMVRGEVR